MRKLSLVLIFVLALLLAISGNATSNKAQLLLGILAFFILALNVLPAAAPGKEVPEPKAEKIPGCMGGCKCLDENKGEEEK